MSSGQDEGRKVVLLAGCGPLAPEAGRHAGECVSVGIVIREEGRRDE